MPTSKLAKRGWILVFLAVTAFYLCGLGALPLIGPDEPRYAQVAREMLSRGDLITPTLGGLPWFEKPALLYWLMMASYRLFGVNEYAARFGPALCGLLTAAFIWWTARNIEKSQRQDETIGGDGPPGNGLSGLAPWSTLAFLTGLGAIGFSRGASFDIVLTMTIAGALSCFLVGQIRGKTLNPDRSWILPAGFYFFLGLALLAKGLVGAILPLGIVAAYFVVRREWPSRKFLTSLAWGIPLTALVAGLWYGPMIYRHGGQFVDQFIVQHHFARFVSNKYHHPQPFYFYLPILALFVAPWTIVLTAAFVSCRKWRWRGRAALDQLRVFTLVWIGVPLIFFSFSGSKIPGYLLPVLPAAALLIGERISCFLRVNRGDIVIRLTGCLFLALAAAGAWYAAHSLGVPFWLVASAAVLPGSVGLLAIARPDFRRLVFMFFALTPLVLAGLALRLSRPVTARDSVRDLMHVAAARGHGLVTVTGLHTVERSAEFYADGQVLYGADGEPVKFEGANQVAEAARRAGGAVLCFVPVEYKSQLTDYQPVQTEVIGDNGRVALVLVRPR